MMRTRDARTALVLLAVLLAGAGCAQEAHDGSPESSRSDPLPSADGPTVLVFTKTAGYRHASIPDGVRMIRDLGRDHGFAVVHSEDAGVFDDEALTGYAAAVFLSTTGDILDGRQQAAFEGYIRGGGGFVGLHAAADTEYDWAWYGGLVGAWFERHPRVQAAVVEVADPAHPSTRMLPARWERTDEWYDYRHNPRGDVHVLLTLDEDSYDGGKMGGDHPIAWCRRYDGGRSWYTGGGHTRESYAEPLFRRHVLGGIRWAMGVEAGECGSQL
ncbi:MAG: ThuA domain-containing protein [Gemmatimonadota bacterium]